jgi:hypothetical protein
MGNKHKRSIRRDANAFSLIMPYIGDLPLSKVHLGTILTVKLTRELTETQCFRTLHLVFFALFQPL